MRALVVGIAIIASAHGARADGHGLEIGAGAPGGLTIGVGVRDDGWQAVVEVGGVAAAFVGMASVSAHLHHDVIQWEKAALAVGASATRLWFIGGSDDVSSGTADTIGPTMQLRRRVSAHAELALDAGPVLGRCRGDCDSRPFVMVSVTARLLYGF